jgi:endonuclease/exonuclease/phosphatase family metal-dependent hydrolase
MRGLVTAQCAVDGLEFGVVGVHLSLVAARREVEARAAVAAAGRLRGPVVICGDFNEPPGRPAWRIFHRAGFVDFGRPDDFTFSSTHRRKRIDAVLVKGAEVQSYGVPPLPAASRQASDHCPVRAVLTLSR